MLGKDSRKVLRYLVRREKAKQVGYTDMSKLDLYKYFTDRKKARGDWIDINFINDILEKLSNEGLIRMTFRTDPWHNRIRLTQNGREYFQIQVKAKELVPMLVNAIVKRLF
ncbi:MAG TPA: hypothetical protein PKE04_08300 [Clostridia bacterium]|nr:hypothetical protein [Clostridia bacterium]